MNLFTFLLLSMIRYKSAKHLIFITDSIIGIKIPHGSSVALDNKKIKI